MNSKRLVAPLRYRRISVLTRRTGEGRTIGGMGYDDGFEVREALRDAARASEVSERLTSQAADAIARADIRAVESEEIAELAERAAVAATKAADRARGVATEAARVARELRQTDGVPGRAEDRPTS